MRRMLPLLLLAALPGIAHGLQPGVALRWNACMGDGGTANRAFACDTNAGVETLVGSFVPGRDFTRITGYEPQVDFFSPTGAIPGWWQMKNAGTCRPASLTLFNTPPAGAVACADAASGLMVGGIGSYEIAFLSPDRIRLRAAYAVQMADTFSILNGQHYFAFRLQINHAKTTGAGACAGCSTPMCIGFSGMRIITPDPDLERTPTCSEFSPPICGTRYMYTPADGVASDRATWQGGVMSAFATSSGFGLPEIPQAFNLIEVSCSAATPARRSAWGAIKSLYR